MPVSADPPAGRSRSSRIADAIVHVIRDQTGRGPVKCRVIMDGDAVVALLSESLTKGERTLLDHDRGDEVLALRRAFQDVARPAFVAEVERITGRKVTTFMSTNHATPDRAAEIFLLDGPLGPA